MHRPEATASVFERLADIASHSRLNTETNAAKATSLDRYRTSKSLIRSINKFLVNYNGIHDDD